MNKTFALLAICFYTLTIIAQDDNAIADQYIVHLYSGVKADALLRSYPQASIKECLSPSMNIWLIQSSQPDLLDKLKSNPSIKVAQHNHTNVKRRSLIPDDTYFGNQWGMRNVSVPGADISATDAWDINHSAVTQTGDSIVIAVIDGTFDIYHNDLNFFVNKNEIPNNGIDDDGNGYIDDYHGWNVFMNNDSVYDIFDNHGTHVAGIAGARTNNNLGVGGVCWGVKILAVDGSSVDESDVVKAYDYVISMRRLYDQTSGAKGAFIVATNSSFGVDRGQPADFPIWCAMYDSLGRYGILSACATANNNYNVDVAGDIPTQCPSKWMIGVTNTNSADARNGSAAYGPISIDIGAPGSGIESTFPSNGYGTLTGTSMATPHIAGAIAAMMANACPRFINDYFAYPDSMALILRDYMFSSADRLPALTDITTTGGRLNLYHAYLAEGAYNCNNCNYNISLSQQNLICRGDSNGLITATIDHGTNYQYLWSTGDSTAQITNLHAGFYQLTVTDSTGCQRSATTLVTQPSAITVTHISIVPITGNANGNIVITATAGNDTLSYAMDTGSFQSGAIFVIDSPGLHHFRIRNAYGCELDTTVNMYYRATGLQDQSSISHISFYPNPTSGIAELMLKSEQPYDAHITLTDLTGRTIMRTSIEITTGLQNKTIDLTSLSDGIYILTITTNDQTLTTTKISVVR